MGRDVIQYRGEVEDIGLLENTLEGERVCISTRFGLWTAKR